MSAIPRVSAIFVLSDPRNFRLVQSAVVQFLQRQTYRNFDVIVANGSGHKLFASVPPNLFDLDLQAVAIPDLLDSAITWSHEHRGNQWVARCSADELYHPNWLLQLMAHRDDKPCLVSLAHQLRIDLSPETSLGCVVSDQDNVSCLIHTSLVRGPWSTKGIADKVVIDNAATVFPGPVLSIGVWHSRHPQTREQFLGAFAEPRFMRTWPTFNASGVGPSQQEFDDYVTWACKQRGLEFKLTRQ